MSSPYTAFLRYTMVTPQSRPVLGREAEMAPNNAGGFGFIVDDWLLFQRFLIIGSVAGTYYVGEQKLTAENAEVAVRCIKADGPRAVAMASEINLNNRAPKTDQQLFVLALALKYGDDATKAAATAAAPAMLRTGTHLLQMVSMLDGLGGWNRSKRRVVANWFKDQDADRLAYQVLKYQNRGTWTMRDALRMTHPTAASNRHRAVFDWICRREPTSETLPTVLQAHRTLAAATDVPAIQAAITAGVPREALPTEALANPDVWRALLPYTPIHALLRNLATLTEKGVLANGSVECAMVAATLTNRDILRKARVHPFAILLATMIYRQGRGARSDKTWTPVPAILSALEDAYDASFANVAPTNKRMLIAIDISGSMDTCCIGTPISAADAAVAMAVTLARLEPFAVVVQFDTAVRNVLPITKRTGIAGLKSAVGGGTDLAAPVLWASGKGTSVEIRQSVWGPPMRSHAVPAREQEFDAFVVLTDNETWAGSQHPFQALQAYRKAVNPKAKLVCCAMAANKAEIVDPKDVLSLGCAGLDATLPAIVADFITN